MAKGVRIDRLFYELGAEVDDFQKGMANAEKSAMRFTTYVMKHPVAAVGALTAAMAALAVQAARMAAAVEANMRKVGAAIPSAQAKLKELTKEVVELSKVTPRTAQELSSALAEIAKGTRDPDEAMKRLRASVLAADAANVDLTATFQGLDAILNAFNLSGRNSEIILAKLFSVAQGRAPLDDLLEVLTKNGAELTRMGFGLDEAAIRMVRLFEKGVPAKNIMAQFKEESKKASGATIDAAKALQDLHTAAQFTRDGTENLFKVLKNQLSAQMIELGTKTLPVVNAELRGMLGLIAQFDGTIANIKTDAAVAAINAIANAWDKLSDESRARDLKRVREALEQIRKTTGFVAGASTQAVEVRTKFSDEQLRAYLRALKVIRQAEGGTGGVGDSVLADFQAEFDRRGLGLTRTTEGQRQGPAAVPVDPEVQKRRDDMIREAQDALVKMSGSLSAAVEHELMRITERAHEVFGKELPAEIEAWVARIREQFATGQVFEGLKTEFDALKDESDQGAEALKAGWGTALADAQAKLSRLARLVQEELDVATLTSDERERLKKLLNAIGVQMAKNAGSAMDLTQAAVDENAEREKGIRRMVELGRRIEVAARGALDLANAFGLVDDRTTDVLENVIKLASNLPAAYKGDPSAIIGVMGSATQLFKHIMGHGPREEREPAQPVVRFETQIDRLVEAIKDFSRTVGELGAVNYKGGDFATAKSILEQIVSAGLGGETPLGLGIHMGMTGQTFDLAKLSEALRGLGIEFDQFNFQAGELAKLFEMLNAIELTQFAQTFTGQLDALRAEFALFDIRDPIEQLKRLVDLFSNPNFGAPALRDALAGLDLTSAEGRAAAKQAIQALFQQMQAGTLDPTGLGGLTGQQFLEQLLQASQLLGSAASAADAGGSTNQFSVERKITEVQADRLLAIETTGLAILQSMLVVQESMRDYLAAIAFGGIGLQAPPLSSLSGFGTASGVRVDVAAGAIVVNVGPGSDPNAIAQALSGSLSDLIVTAIESRSRHHDAAHGTPLLS